MKADIKDKHSNISLETAKKALELFEKALPLAEIGIDLKKWKPATPIIKKNILYCKRVLGLEPWPIKNGGDVLQKDFIPFDTK